MNPIGIIHSPFPEKFGVPRAPGLTPSVEGNILINPPYNRWEAFEDLKEYSHLWLIFEFHLIQDREFSSKVRPPRLGGNKRFSVFATRSPFRPNKIGLSLVELLGLSYENSQLKIQIRSPDLVDGTPILDIKPFMPNYDIPQNYRTPNWPNSKNFLVQFSKGLEHQIPPNILRQVEEVLRLNPAPAYESIEKDKKFRMNFDGYSIHWSFSDEFTIIVEEIFLNI